MITITIQRREKNDICVTGLLKAVSSENEGIVRGHTLEPPDLNGLGQTEKPSCIKPDRYKATLYDSPKFQRTVVLLENKHGRDWIEIHAGNYPKDTVGCILVGTSQGKNAVWESGQKLNELIDFIQADIEATGDDEFVVIVKDVV